MGTIPKFVSLSHDLYLKIGTYIKSEYSNKSPHEYAKLHLL